MRAEDTWVSHVRDGSRKKQEETVDEGWLHHGWKNCVHKGRKAITAYSCLIWWLEPDARGIPTCGPAVRTIG